MSRVAQALSSTMFHGLAYAGRLHPQARPARHGVAVERDRAYGPDPAHVLDIYRPIARAAPLPVVFYVHGGAFRILSKDTHWLMGLAFARAGYLVVNISYRLAPRHRFPAAIEDTCRAWRWMLEALPALGGDPARIAVAGESAGANLITALTLATVDRRPEPFAAAVFDAGVVPGAALPFCGLLEVSRPERFAARKRLPAWVQGMLTRTAASYLGDTPAGLDRALADPLVVLEGGVALARPLPPMFAPVGTRDPLLDDTRRLEKALAARGVPCEARYYPGGVHAFHAFVWQAQARRCWGDALAFLARTLR
ncbi:MAG: alpha/beta hydrolase fold domain-containing protein [Kofleriaceae bacterium]